MDHSYETYVLSDGLKLFFVPMKGIGHVYSKIYIGYGSQSETTKETLEMAHMVEHFQAKYTSKKHPKSKPIEKWMADTGCEKNASTYLPYTIYYMTCLKQYFPQILEIQLRSLTDFVLDKTIFNAERNSVIEEIQSNFLNYTWIDLHEKTNQKLSQVPWLRSQASERIKLVKKIKPSDILRFRNERYDPSKIMITIGGDFDCQRTKRMIEKFFSKKKQQPHYSTNPQLMDYTKVFETTFVGPEIMYVQNKKVKNTRIQFTWVLPSAITPSNVHTQVVLNFIRDLMASDMDSRLMRILRIEKEMVYFVSMNISLDYNGHGEVVIATETNPKNIQKVVEIIYSEIQKIKTQPISSTEMERIKNKNILSAVEEPMYKHPSKYVERYARYFFYGKPVVLQKDWLKLVHKATKKDIMNVSKQIFQDNKLLIGYSGPQKKKIGLKDFKTS